MNKYEYEENRIRSDPQEKPDPDPTFLKSPYFFLFDMYSIIFLIKRRNHNKNSNFIIAMEILKHFLRLLI